MKNRNIWRYLITLGLIVFCIWMWPSPSPKRTTPAPREPDELSAPSALVAPPTSTAAPVREPAPQTAEAPFKAETSIEKIIQTDDLCSLEDFLRSIDARTAGNARSLPQLSPQQMALRTYFSTTPFKSNYEDYERSQAGRPSFQMYTRFLGALRYANWVEGASGKPAKFDKMRAVRYLTTIALDDPGNAAPIAFALAILKTIDPKYTMEFRGREPTEFYDVLDKSDRFDSYRTRYLGELKKVSDPKAVGLVLRTLHATNLPVPKWNEFANGFSAATETHPELRQTVTDLMIRNAKEAKEPSFQNGYDALETSSAKAIAGTSRAYPSFKEIDQALQKMPDPAATEIWSLINQPSALGACDKERVKKIRNFARTNSVLISGNRSQEFR